MGKNFRRSIVGAFLIAATLIVSLSSIAQVEAAAPTITRYEGYSRDNVAENVAKAHFSDSNKVILVNREKFPDAISATNISQGKYPVLYTHAGHVTEGTIQTLQSMSLDEIYILGGTLSISDAVAEQLKQETGVKVTRVAGRSRYDANVEAIKENFTQENHVVIASGEVFSDALYGVSYANTIDAPVVLTKTNQLEASTIQLLKDLGANQATIIGGALTVTPEVEKQLSALGISHDRIAGRNRYIGSAEVANAAYQNPANAVIASGEVFSDALVSAPLAQKLDAPILLVRPDSLEKAVEDYLATHMASLENIYIQGGPLTITKENEENIAKAGQVDEIVLDQQVFSQELLKLVNELRVSVGVHKLTYDNTLQQGANIRAREVLDVFSHTRPDGRHFITAFGYEEPNYYLGENIAYNYITEEGNVEREMAKKFFNQYYNSEGHYENMISDRYVTFATGVTLGENNKVSNAQIFGTTNRESEVPVDPEPETPNNPTLPPSEREVGYTEKGNINNHENVDPNDIYGHLNEDVYVIPYETVYVENPLLEEGQEELLLEGVNGTGVNAYEVTYLGGGAYQRTLVDKFMRQNPVNRVVVVREIP